MIGKHTLILLILSLLVGCSGLEKSEKKKVRERNLTSSPVQRQSDEFFFSLPPLVLKKREPYPFENKRIGAHLRITKEFFRCKGSHKNSPIQVIKYGNLVYHLDCMGIDTHSLPLRDNKEFIYPILIDLLNHIQEKTKKQVIITCGHRCPTHNLYADPTKKGQTSKHLVGAEVDFYVEGLENSPQAVIETLMSYYDEPLQMSHANTWYNKEVVITLFGEGEGRDLDNAHPYPYISIQVLYDRNRGRPVRYNWNHAHYGYIKY